MALNLHPRFVPYVKHEKTYPFGRYKFVGFDFDQTGARGTTMSEEDVRLTDEDPNASVEGEKNNPESVGAILEATQTKQKLTKLMNDFNSFDDNMKIGTRQRREKDEHRLAEMRKEMIRLEQALTAEVKRRLEMNKSLQSYCDDEVAKIQEQIDSIWEKAKEAQFGM